MSGFEWLLIIGLCMTENLWLESDLGLSLSSSHDFGQVTLTYLKLIFSYKRNFFLTELYIKMVK